MNLDSLIISKLESKNIWEYFNSREEVDPVTQKVIIQLSEIAMPIKLIDDNLCYQDESGDWNCMPDDEAGIFTCGEWLSNLIPSPTFDIHQGGSIRKAEQAECIYCTFMVKQILNDVLFSKEFDDICKDYDFDTMSCKGNSDVNFKGLLDSWQSLQSFTINVIISACKFCISRQKKDIEKFLKDGLTMEEQVGLSDLDTDIKRIFSKYTTGDGTLSPREVGKKKKVEILEAIEDQNSEIKAILDKSKYKTLHKIINLTSEYITPLKKKKIQYLISEQMVLHFEGSIESETIDFSSFESRMRKRALRIERNSVRRKEILKYIENRDSYVLPSKR